MTGILLSASRIRSDMQVNIEAEVMKEKEYHVRRPANGSPGLASIHITWAVHMFNAIRI